MKSGDASTSELSFEEAFARLEAVVARLESSGLSVDELVSEFEAGMGLVKHCQRQLEAAQFRVALLLREDEDARLNGDGGVSAEAPDNPT